MFHQWYEAPGCDMLFAWLIVAPETSSRRIGGFIGVCIKSQRMLLAVAVQIEGNGAARMVVAHMAIQILARARPLRCVCMGTIGIRLVGFARIAASGIEGSGRCPMGVNLAAFPAVVVISKIRHAFGWARITDAIAYSCVDSVGHRALEDFGICKKRIQIGIPHVVSEIRIVI